MLMICPNLSHWWPTWKGQKKDKNTSEHDIWAYGMNTVLCTDNQICLLLTPICLCIYLSIWISDFYLVSLCWHWLLYTPTLSAAPNKNIFQSSSLSLVCHDACQTYLWKSVFKSFCFVWVTHRKFALWFQGKTKMDSQWYLTRDDLFKNILSSP